MPWLIIIVAFQTILLCYGYYLLEREYMSFSLPEVLLWALIFRLLFLFSHPSLSDDIYRYAWDGCMMASVKNPYLHAPTDFFHTDMPHRLSTILSRINHPGTGTVYPPGAQLFFGLSQLLFHGIISVKFMLILIDIFSCRLLFRLSPLAQAAIVYAWSPLAVIECSSSGHIDILMTALLLSSLFMLKKALTNIAGFFLALSALTKVVPIIFYPIFFHNILHKYSLKAAIRFSLSMAITGTILLLPFGKGLPYLWHNLGIYASQWEFSGFLYNMLKPFMGGNASRLVLLVMLIAVTFHPVLKKRALYPRILVCYLAFLLTSATVHPWYLLPAVALLPLVPTSSGFILSWCAFLPYFTVIEYGISGHWAENHLMTFILFCALSATFIQVWIRDVNPFAPRVRSESLTH